MIQFIIAVATGCYSGMLPWVPGTWGSLAALLPCYFMQGLPLFLYSIITAALFTVGTIFAGMAEKILDKPDPSIVVIDEIVGIFITYIAVPDGGNPYCWIAGFLFFRFFDIVKPFPISWIDTYLHGGLAIMLDDGVAGIYACVLLHISWQSGAFIFA